MGSVCVFVWDRGRKGCSAAAHVRQPIWARDCGGQGRWRQGVPAAVPIEHGPFPLPFPHRTTHSCWVSSALTTFCSARRSEQTSEIARCNNRPQCAVAMRCMRCCCMLQAHVPTLCSSDIALRLTLEFPNIVNPRKNFELKVWGWCGGGEAGWRLGAVCANNSATPRGPAISDAIPTHPSLQYTPPTESLMPSYLNNGTAVSVQKQQN